MKNTKARLLALLAVMAMLMAVSVPVSAQDVTFTLDDCDVDGDGWSGEDVEDGIDNDGDGWLDEDNGLDCWDTAQEIADALGGEITDADFDCTEFDNDGDGEDDDGDGETDEDDGVCEEGTLTFDVE